MRLCAVIIFLILPLTYSDVYSTTVYRYKDESGRWQFSDKKPKQNHEQLDVQSKIRDKKLPRLYLSKGEQGAVVMANNPWFAPVVFEILISGQPSLYWTVEAKHDGPILDGEGTQPEIGNKPFSYQYRLGRVIQKADGQALRPPTPKLGKFEVTQGFNGAFSHNHIPHQYAVDIAMNISDHVHAARSGVVVKVKDDYHMGGTAKFFLDKANQIVILHSDDTFGVYAHILLGSALVKPGDKVEAGDPIANVGTSGYSTGPHLHFTLRYNNGTETVSSPFEFKHVNGVGQPKFKQWLQVAPGQ